MIFTLTIHVPDTTPFPARRIAQVLREVGPVIEVQTPLAEHQHVPDRLGGEMCEWSCEPDEPEPEPEPETRRMRR
jgi:hypothetical protein